MRARLAILIDCNDIEFVKLLRPYKYPERYPDLSQAACKQEIQDKFLHKYEQMLKDKPFLFGLKSIADIAIFPFIRQFSLVDQEWFYASSYKNIIRWLKTFMDDSDFKNIIMTKYEVWSEFSKPVYLFPNT